jgi:hypothetical protein
MMAHPEIVQRIAQQHRDELLHLAENERLLSAARRYRRQARRRHR